MTKENPGTRQDVPKAESTGPERKTRRDYQPPRIEKKRAVSRATLFTGSGPDSGGIFGNG